MTADPPHLEAPGAGLPRLERFALKLGLGCARTVRSRAWANTRFRTEARRMIAVATDLDDESASAPLLVRKVAGIEDSSRCWSVFMVLDHLRIADDWMIECIAAGQARRGLDDRGIADMKPDPAADRRAVAAFAACCERYAEAIASHGDLRAGGTVPHPWFGPLDGHGWHMLAALHHSIHRRQVQRIVAGLASAGAT